MSKTIKLKTKTWEKAKRKPAKFPPAKYSLTPTLDFSQVWPYMSAFLRRVLLIQNLDGFVGCYRVDQIPKYWHVPTRILWPTLLVYSHTRWHYYDMICLYPWLCPSSRSSVASVYMKFQKSNLPHCYCHNHLEKVDVSHFTCDVPKRMVSRVKCCKCDFWKHLVDSKS